MLRRPSPDGYDDAARRILAVTPRLVAKLAQAFPDLGADRAEAAIVDAAADWLGSRRSDSGWISPGWLYKAAWRRARDIVAGDRARHAREIEWALEQGPGFTVSPSVEDESSGLLVSEVLEEVLRSLPDDQMRVTFRLWIRGVRQTDLYARALGIETLPKGLRQREVKRHKDRLLKRLRRDPGVRRLAWLLRSE